MNTTGNVILEDPNVHISLTRAIINGITYAMANITSVRMLKKNPSYAGPVVLGCLGILILLFHAWLFAIILIAGGIAWGASVKPEYTILVGTAGGEHAALRGKDFRYIQSIVQAMNDAIVARG